MLVAKLLAMQSFEFFDYSAGFVWNLVLPSVKVYPCEVAIVECFAFLKLFVTALSMSLDTLYTYLYMISFCLHARDLMFDLTS